MIYGKAHHLITQQVLALGQWLDDEAPYPKYDQRHLDPGTVEQAYWHLGYREAMMDVLALINGENRDIPDRSTPIPPDDSGA